MSIWNTAETVSLNCPTCGDALRYDSAINASVCRSCGNVYEAGTLNLTGKLKFVDVDNASEREENKREYVCGSCGATVVTDENTAATFCAFCGSPSVMGRRLAKEFRPDYIIPFKISKDEAVKRFKEWVGKSGLAPRSIVSSKIISKITGLYVPFWLINADCYSTVSGVGYFYDNAQERSLFSFNRKMLFKVKNVPFDGSFKISNFLMHSIEPFDYKDLCEFDDTYLPGYYAQRYDKNALDLTEVIDIRISKFAAQAGETLVNANQSSSGIRYKKADADSTESYIKNLSQSYALLPVWFLNFEYDGESYQIAINGQTGKVSGDIPVSKWKNIKHNLAKNFLHLLIWFVPFILGTIWLIAGMIIPPEQGGALILVGFGLWFISGLLTAVMVPMIRKNWVSLSSDIESEPDVSEYFDFSYTPQLIQSSDQFMGHQIWVSDRKRDGEGAWMDVKDARTIF